MNNSIKIQNIQNKINDKIDKNPKKNRISVGMIEDTYCVVCGRYVPEGFMVCRECEKDYNL